MVILRPFKKGFTMTLIYSQAGHRVSRFQLPESEKEWMTRAVNFQWNMLHLLTDSALGGSFGKTSPAFYRRTTDETLKDSSNRWLNAGTVSHGECLTLKISESPSAAVESCLSDIVETGDVHSRHYLTAKACNGILRRDEKRGVKLSERLRLALATVVITSQQNVDI